MNMYKSSAFAVAVTTLVLATASSAQVPQRVNFNARLTDSSGVPVSGSHQVALSLFDAATGGTSAWSETTTPTFSATGTVSIEMGATTPLTAAIFTGASLFLQITIDGTPLTPRVGIASVPYSIRAGTADSVGALQAADIQRRVTGTCTTGQAMQSVAADGTVGCAAVAGGGVTAVTASAPLSVATGTTTPALSISQASSSSPGYLSAADWNSFNSRRGTGGSSIVDWTSTIGNWTLGSGQAATITLNTADVLEGDSSFDFFVPSGTTGAGYTYGQQVAVDTRLPHVGRISAKYVSGGGTFSAGIEAYNAAGTSVGTRYFIISATDLTTTTGWQSFAGYIQGEGGGTNQFPAGTRFIRPRVILSNTNIGQTRVDAFSFEPIVAIRRVARTQGYTPDGSDNAVLAGRGVSLIKVSRSTGIRVGWSDNFRVAGNNTACSWQVLFNGAACTNPGRIAFDKYEGGTSSNRHDPASVFGTCFATAAGPLAEGVVTVTTRVGPAPGYGVTDCYTGWTSALFSLEAEEVL